LPNFVPSNFNFFGVTIGIEIVKTGHNKLDDKGQAGDNSEKFDDIADKKKETGTFDAGGNARIIFESIGRKDFPENGKKRKSVGFFRDWG